MIFNRCDADPQTLMDLAIAKFLDAVHQKNSSRLLAETCNGALIEPKQVGGFHTELLLRRTGKIMFFQKRKKDDLVAPATDCTIDQQVSSNALEEGSRVCEAMPLFAADGTQEHFLHKIRGCLWTDVSPKVAKQYGAIIAKGSIQCGVPLVGDPGGR